VSLNSLSVAGDIHTSNKFGKTLSVRRRTGRVTSGNEKGLFDDESCEHAEAICIAGDGERGNHDVSLWRRRQSGINARG
jgi:hypothetical protein